MAILFRYLFNALFLLYCIYRYNFLGGKEKRQPFSLARQQLSVFISAYSTGVSTFLSARTEKLSVFVRVFKRRQNRVYTPSTPYIHLTKKK